MQEGLSLVTPVFKGNQDRDENVLIRWTVFRTPANFESNSWLVSPEDLWPEFA